MFNPRLGCSSISFRHQDLSDALRTISALGFEEIDLGALPGVCEHVPYDLDADAVTAKTGAKALVLPCGALNINLSIGNGHADFAAGLRELAASGYAGHFSLELETHDVTHDERPAATAKAASYITDLL